MNKKDEKYIEAFFDGKESGFEEGRKRGHDEARVFIRRFSDRYAHMTTQEFEEWLKK